MFERDPVADAVNDQASRESWQRQLDAFKRERKGFLLVSTLLLFYTVADVQINKLTILGSEIQIKNPWAIPASLWAAAVYWLWRFLTHFPVTWSDILDTIHDDEGPWLEKRVKRKPISAILKRKALQKAKEEGIEVFDVHVVRMKRFKPWTKSSIDVQFDYRNKEVGIEGKILDVPLPLRYSIYGRIRTILRLLFLGIYFTEYLLPLILFTVAGVYTVVRWF